MGNCAVVVTLLVALVASGCKPRPPHEPASGRAARDVDSSSPSASAVARPALPPDAAGGSSGALPALPPASAAIPGSPAPTAPGSERHGPPLPELRVKSFGLHIGGGASDADSRREVLRNLERAFPRYLDCYRQIDEPGVEGTFGADLHVAAEGGRAKVLQPRTKLPGEPFRACMIKAFESTRFEAPRAGRALVVSYSVKFSFGW